VGRTGEGDGKLISADRNPNVRGALLTGLVDTLPADDLAELGRMIDAGEVSTILAVGESLCDQGISAEQLKKVDVIYVGTHHCDTSQFAKVEIPLLTVFEKSGTFVNQQFRVQKFFQAVPGPKGVLFGLSNLTRIFQAVSGEKTFAPSPAAIWKQMAAEIPEFSGLAFEEIPQTGVLVSGERFAAVPFVEGPSLHFEPRKETAGA